MHKQLRKPANWQAFEQRCKQLWGETCRVPYAIKLHGRSGQAQHGVDIYAVPEGQVASTGLLRSGQAIPLRWTIRPNL